MRRHIVVFLTLAALTGGCQGYQKDSSARTIGEVTDDVAIETRIKMALFHDPDIKGLRVHVQSRRGVVVLTGRVEGDRQAQEAVRLASGMKGVRRVENHLTVVTD